MIPPRLRRLLVSSFVLVQPAKEIPRAHRVGVSTSIGTPQGTATDWLALEKKGLIRFSRAEALEEMFGGRYFSVNLLDAGAEEIADDVARIRAEWCAP